MSTDQLEPASHAAGACLLVVAVVGAIAIVFAVSPTAGIFTVWGAGTVALWRAARRRVSVMSATPPPVAVAPQSGIDADQARKAARVATDPNGVMCIIHAPAGEVTNP